MAQNIQVSIVAQDRFSSAARKIKEATHRMQMGMSRMSRSFGRGIAKVEAFGAASIAVGRKMMLGLTLPIVAGAVLAVKAMSDEEEANVKLALAYKKRHGVLKFTKKDLHEIANKLQDVTRFGDEAGQTLEAFLLPLSVVTKMTKKQLSETINLIADYAEVMKVALPRAGKRFAMAFADPVLAMESFKMAGIEFGKATQAAIKHYVAIGEKSKATALELDVVKDAIGGAAKMAGTTFPVQLIQLKNAFGDMLKPIGLLMIRGLQPFVKSLTEIIKKFQKVNPVTLKWVVGIGGVLAVLPLLVSAIGYLAGGIVSVYKVVKLLTTTTLLLDLATSPLTIVIVALGVAAYELWKHWGAVKRIFWDVVKVIKAHVLPAFDWIEKKIHKITAALKPYIAMWQKASHEMYKLSGGAIGSPAKGAGAGAHAGAPTGMQRAFAIHGPVKILVHSVVELKDKGGHVASVRTRAFVPATLAATLDRGHNQAGT